MIAKHVPMRKVKKSDFRELVEYLNDPQTKQERVGRVTVTNCFQDNPLDAAFEVQATQALNTRSESDKTYHLIISFPEGESPSPEILEAIEARICAALGFADHQRVSAVHHDTDNLHIHVAINKIHPTRYTIHTPFNDYKTLGDICEKLELEYGLSADNHMAGKTRSENLAGDMERHAGVESLLGWIKRECAQQMTNARSWAELHEVMRSNGLVLSERGNGLVITDRSGRVGVKASSVARELSKTKLESRLGAYEAPIVREPSTVAVATRRSQAPRVEKVGSRPPPRSKGQQGNLSDLRTMQIDGGRSYSQQPIFNKQINSVELHARYKTEQLSLNVARSNAVEQARSKKERLVAAAKRSNRLKRAAIKMLQGPGVNKKLLYALASRSLRNDLTRINADYLKDREAAYQTHSRLAWADWLKAMASQGNSEALAALRAREPRQDRSKETVGGEKILRPGTVPGLKPDNITKAGTIIYRVGSTAIRDDGRLLNVSRGAGEHGLEAALRMAMHRYGDRIAVSGSAEFKERIAQVAAAARLRITFDDAALEQRRQHLVDTAATHAKLAAAGSPGVHIEFTPAQARHAGAVHEDALSEQDAEQSRSQIAKKGPNHDHREDTQGTSHERGRRNRRSNGAATGGRPNLREPTGVGRSGPARAGSRGADKPHIGRIGRQPPAASQNRLRNLSELGVVQLASRSEVLLPGDVPRDVEHQRGERDNGVRRSLHRPGIDRAQTAAEKYVVEREEKRAKGIDIERHRLSTSQDEGPAEFAGLRHVAGETLMLLRRNGEVMVLPVTTTTISRMKRLSVGDKVLLTAQGGIKVKGRSI